MMLPTDVPSTGLALSECCSLRECSHHPAVCPQKSGAAGQVGSLLVLDFSFDILNGRGVKLCILKKGVSENL